eukprot:4713757-Heterocapsa_arctica.AAC.1
MTKKWMLSVHVDDLLVVVPHDEINGMKSEIEKKFKAKWIGVIQGVEQALGKSIPETYYDHVLADHGLSTCRPVCTPYVAASRYGKSDGDMQLDDAHHASYRRTVGRLMWLLPERADLVKELARSVQNPTDKNWGDM